MKMPVTPLSKAGEVIDVIARFIAAPPEGTPAEIIEAFGDLPKDQMLPPRLFLETVEQAPVAISIADPKAKILYANVAFERLTGYTRDEVIGMNESVLSSKTTPEEVYHQLWKDITAGKTWQGKLVNRHKAGEDYLAEVMIPPVLNAAGEIAYFLGMHRDLTEVHRLQERVKFQKGLTETALNALPMVMTVISSEGKIILDNLAYKTLASDLKAEPLDLFDLALREQVGHGLIDARKGSVSLSNAEVRLEIPGHPDPRWFACSLEQVPGIENNFEHYFSSSEPTRYATLFIANEVTESRARLNLARMNMLKTTMMEQRLLSTMKEAVSAAIFKLQIPLNVIKAALALPGAQSPGLKAALEQALETGDEALENLYDLLPQTNEEAFSQQNINELIHDVLTISTERLLGQGVVVDWQPASTMAPVYGRGNALRSLFKYLLDNAITALAEVTGDLREVSITTYERDGEVHISICDNGCGINPGDHARVFEPFYSCWTNRKSHAGMGLTLAQEVVITHRGTIFFDDKVEQGTCVRISLPNKAQ